MGNSRRILADGLLYRKNVYFNNLIEKTRAQKPYLIGEIQAFSYRMQMCTCGLIPHPILLDACFNKYSNMRR